MTPTNKVSDLPVYGVVILDVDMREWAQSRGLSLLYIVGWHVMMGEKFCTTGYDTPQKALEALWESGEVE